VSALEKLQFDLTAFLREEAQRSPARIGPFAKMTHLAEQIKRRHGLSQTGYSPPQQRLDVALGILYREGVTKACETRLRYLCYALTRPYGSDQRRLISDATRFSQILSQLEARVYAQGLPLRGWHGLLDAYFQFDGTGDKHSQANWCALRTLLSQTLASIQSQIVGRQPQKWLETLVEHPNLLTNDPCGRYANAVLHGDLAETDALREHLHIPEQSWFWIDLLRAQARALTNLGDKPFHNLLDGFLDRLGDPRRVPDVLATLLERYHRSQFQNTTHQRLQQTILEAWGSPNLRRSVAWGHVSDPVRQMVLRWLSREDIQDFFRLLIQDCMVDERRLRFWMRYADFMQETHIALGKSAAMNNEPDFVELRQRKSGRVSILGDTNYQNNAFIMNFGQYVAVEFSGTGNACFIYAASDFPMPEYSKVRDIPEYKGVRKAIPVKRIPISMIKNNRRLTRLIHIRSWEKDFESSLGRYGIYSSNPEETHARLTPRVGLPTGIQATASVQTSPLGEGKPGIEESSSQRTVLPPKPPPAERVYERLHSTVTTPDLNLLLSMAKSYGVVVHDMREQGGPLWVRHLIQGDHFGKLFAKLGMRFTPDKGYWIK